MEFLNDPLLAAIAVSKILSIVWVGLGLGLVIFFHELGHFAVAKWCNVQVERFSIGFGPILWSRKWGETEYALSAIPFGGYVKMLGQDDLDPSQLSSEDIAKNPRSYSAKNVPQRMAIISAGVIMNVLTAMIFFGLAFGMGIVQQPSVLGLVGVGRPAWTAGLRAGDRITSINGRDVETFGDITRGTALSSGDLNIEYVRPDGSTHKVVVTPDRSGSRPQIGVSPIQSLTIDAPAPDDEIPFITIPGTPAASASPPLEPGDEIRTVDGVEVKTFTQFADILSRRRDDALKIEVARGSKRNSDRRYETITIEPNSFRSLGLWMDIGKITAIQEGSPAAEGGLLVEDKITKVNGKEIGADINPIDLPDLLWSLHGEKVVLTVLRPTKPEARTVDLTVVPIDRPGWTEPMIAKDNPLSIPAIGAAFHIGRTIRKVEPGSPADEAKIIATDRISEVKLIRAADGPKDLIGPDEFTISLVRSDKEDKDSNWAYAWWQMQQAPTRIIKLVVTDETGKKSREIELTPRPDESRHSPLRGFVLAPERMTMKAEGFPNAVKLGFTHTRNTIVDIYLSLRSLVTGRVALTEAQGPIGIAKIAYGAANEGFAELMLFLGVLSVNLAVINFLPIPVLDGGHMVFLIWEGVTRRKPSERILIAAQYFGMAFVLALMLAVLYLDLFVHTKK